MAKQKKRQYRAPAPTLFVRSARADLPGVVEYRHAADERLVRRDALQDLQQRRVRARGPEPGVLRAVRDVPDLQLKSSYKVGL